MQILDIIAYSIMGAFTVAGIGTIVVTSRLIEQVRSLTATVGSLRKIQSDSTKEMTNDTKRTREAFVKELKDIRETTLSAIRQSSEENTRSLRALTKTTEIAGLGPQAASEAIMLNGNHFKPSIPWNDGLSDWADINPSY